MNVQRRRLIQRVMGSCLLVCSLLLAAAMPAAATSDQAAEQIRYGEIVDLAGGVWTSESEGLSSSFEIRVFHTAQRSSDTGRLAGNGTILFYDQWRLDPSTGNRIHTAYEGFAGSGVDFRFDPSLAGATADIALTLWGYRCILPPAGDGGGASGIAVSQVDTPECWDLPDVPTTVHLEWVGVGPIDRSVDKSTYREAPYYLFHAHTVSAVRDASVTAVFHGEGLELPFPQGTATFGVLLRGHYHEQNLWAR